MTKFNTPQNEQGQIVINSYGWIDGVYYCMVYDQGDRTTSWYQADEEGQEEVDATGYDAGGSSFSPPVKEWIPCEAPEEES